MKTAAKQKRPVSGKADALSVARADWNAIIPKRAPAAALAALNVPVKWRWHHRVLADLQERLLRERGDLLGTSAEPIEPHSLDEADSATDEFDHDLALTQLAAEQDALSEVNDALRRIQDGGYGICEATGRAIPAVRLRAIPWARFTLEAESRREKKGMVRGARLSPAATVRSSGELRLKPEEEPEESEETPTMTSSDEALSPVESQPLRRSRRLPFVPRNQSKPTSHRHASR